MKVEEFGSSIAKGTFDVGCGNIEDVSMRSVICMIDTERELCVFWADEYEEAGENTDK